MTPKPFGLPSTWPSTSSRSLPSVSTMIRGARSRYPGSMYLSHRSTGSSTCPSASITSYLRGMVALLLDHAIASELFNLGRVVAEQLAVHLGVVLAQQRRSHHVSGRLGQPHGVRRHRVLAPPGMLEIHDHAAFFEMGIAQHLGGVEHGSAGQSRAGQDLHHLVLGPL